MNKKFRDAILLLTSTMTVMAGATISPSLPGMRAHFSNTPNAEFWVQMVLTAPGLMIAITAPFIGWLLDSWKKKPCLLLALGLYAAAGMAGYWLDNLLPLLFSRLLLGVAVAAIMVTCTTLIADYYPGPERGKYMGLMAAFGAFGGVVFVGLASGVVTLGWRAPFTIYVLGFVLLPFVLMAIVEPEQAQIENKAKQQSIQESGPTKFVFLCYALGFLEVFLLYSVPVYLPFYTQDFPSAFHLSNAVLAGISIAFMLLVLALVAVQYGKVKRNLSFESCHILGLLTVAVGFGVLSYANSWMLLALAMLVLGVGFGLVRPNLTLWLFAFIEPQHRGRVMGGLTSAFFIAQFLCPILLMPMVIHLGYANTFLLTALACATVAVCLVVRETLSMRGIRFKAQ